MRTNIDTNTVRWLSVRCQPECLHDISRCFMAQIIQQPRGVIKYINRSEVPTLLLCGECSAQRWVYGEILGDREILGEKRCVLRWMAMWR